MWRWKKQNLIQQMCNTMLAEFVAIWFFFNCAQNVFFQSLAGNSKKRRMKKKTELNTYAHPHDELKWVGLQQYQLYLFVILYYTWTTHIQWCDFFSLIQLNICMPRCVCFSSVFVLSVFNFEFYCIWIELNSTRCKALKYVHTKRQ